MPPDAPGRSSAAALLLSSPKGDFSHEQPYRERAREHQRRAEAGGMRPVHFGRALLLDGGPQRSYPRSIVSSGLV
jgi:hypothetical protein